MTLEQPSRVIHEFEGLRGDMSVGRGFLASVTRASGLKLRRQDRFCAIVEAFAVSGQILLNEIQGRVARAKLPYLPMDDGLLDQGIAGRFCAAPFLSPGLPLPAQWERTFDRKR